jgi:N-acetylglucosamine kinase-like BadF-type ATPase
LKGLKIGPERQEFKAVQKKALICGLAGLSSDAYKVPPLREMFVMFGFQPTHIFIASDIEVAKQLLSDHGAVLIAGTGSICFSKVSGKEKCIGGYGPLLGDEGSGFYVGKLALQAAFQTVEEDKPFILMQALITHFKVSCITDVIEGVYDHKIQISEVAKITPLVFDSAFEKNDERCKNIVSQCASELAKLITRAVDGSSQANFPIYLMGGIFKDKNHDQFINMIRQKVIYNPVLTFVNISQKNIVSEIVKSTQKENQDMNQ